MIWKRFKAVASWLHLWVGLVTGMVVVIVGTTGCILVFEDELFDYFHRDIIEVTETGPARPVSELLATVQKHVGKKGITDVRMNEADQSYVFTARELNKVKDMNLSCFSQFKYYDNIYVNQYTGKVTGTIDITSDFFYITEQLHRQLLLVKPVGSVVVGSCILLFLLMMITGFILWLPKNYKQFKQNISVKWKAKFKRINYDLHNSFGFYVLPIAILIAITGLVWSFKWWEAGIYSMLGEKEPIKLVRKAPHLTTADTTDNHINMIVADLESQLKGDYRLIGLSLPSAESKVMMAFVYGKQRVDNWRNMSYYFYDGRTGKMIDKMRHGEKPLGLKWRNSNKDIHTGRIFGPVTQILAFLASFICASLPVTGFLIWWGKRNKKNKKKAGIQHKKTPQPALNTI
ncbi:PepSY-associated TM helix domain-containing protein [Mucilaginibacter terrae]|uniref:Iron-regulated membrane protein n=1 Tax=Mucilaginibacter terrae TaxID=1955052 RepID=A0ABU3GTH3_9SPHI|nr:PepSY-associated TM helix domain-containing protein [Mucilaginibacter terrae]MDT3403073.1 putative iron-regulated membrane protein [Mucilaginibacter terrae]